MGEGMSYLEKCNENENAAILLFENKYYNASINRFYYSSFQHIVHILNNNGIELNDDEKNSEGSHDKAIRKLDEYLRKKGTRYLTKAHKIKSKYKDIKKFRKNADYEEIMCDEQSANDVKSIHNEIKNLLKSI